jgi:SulP family sulfate permease
VAVEVGLVLSCVFFVWRMSQLFSVQRVDGDRLPEGVVAFELYGALFFGAVGKLEPLPEQLPEGSRALVLDMHRLIAIDTSGLDALRELHRSLQRRGVALLLADVNPQPLSLFKRSGFMDELGEAQVLPQMVDVGDLKSPD